MVPDDPNCQTLSTKLRFECLSTELRSGERGYRRSRWPFDRIDPVPVSPKPPAEEKPIRFQGTVMLSADRPARDMHQIVEAIVEQLTTLQGAEVTRRLEIDAKVASGLDRSKVRTLLKNANTLNFIDKAIK